MVGLRTQKRRRRENKTDYKLRKGLLKSPLPRIVIRRTNKYFIVQIVESDEAKDKVILGATSKELLKKGWDEKKAGSLKSIPAGYLTGILLAKKAKKGKFILDLGMTRTIHGARVFAVIKGLIEGGLEISTDEKAFPSEERLEGHHINQELKTMITKIKSKL